MESWRARQACMDFQVHTSLTLRVTSALGWACDGRGEHFHPESHDTDSIRLRDLVTLPSVAL
eukprot:671838-Rhodomonas_salina.1